MVFFPQVAQNSLPRCSTWKCSTVAGSTPSTPPETFDINGLNDAERTHLSELLTLGDIPEAAAWAKNLGPSANALVAEITSFRTDGLLARL